MDNLMTLIMSVVRKMTGSDQKMDVSDATNALSTLAGFKINLSGGDYDLNQLSGNQILFIGGMENGNYLTPTVAQNNVPIDGAWWLVINIDTTTEGNMERKFQLCIPDGGDVSLYLRREAVGTGWTAWTKLGG